ncbi:MAG: hypothetical protein WCI31_09265 [Prolixibacteraceae bacterium]
MKKLRRIILKVHLLANTVYLEEEVGLMRILTDAFQPIAIMLKQRRI